MEPDMIASRTSLPSIFAAAAVLAALVALLPGSATAQIWGGQKITGSGVSKTDTRAVSGFHSVVLSVHANLKLSQGGSEGVTITGDDNILPLVETVVQDGTLTIRWADKRKYSTSYKDLEIVVNARNIDGLTIDGSGHIQADRLKTARLHATIDGSGDIVFGALDADSLTAAINGSGSVTAAGRADSLDIAVAGSGRLSAAKLDSNRAKVGLHGSGHATLRARDELDAVIAGSGEINYYGKPKLTTAVAGSGRITQLGDAS
jgi:hypothetical protein